MSDIHLQVPLEGIDGSEGHLPHSLLPYFIAWVDKSSLYYIYMLAQLKTLELLYIYRAIHSTSIALKQKKQTISV
jgi:hypothetical protein